MSAKAATLFAALMTALCACRGWAQDPRRGSEEVPPPSALAPSGIDTLPPSAAPATAGPSSWLTYTKPDCCGPTGRDGPIDYELYIFTGPSLTAGGSFLDSTLDNGWLVQGGARTLFFNAPVDKAWVIDLGLGYEYNHGNHPDLHFAFLGTDVHVSTLHRTYANGAIGREIYLFKPANGCGLNWRAGVDVGLRYGSARLDLNRTSDGGLERIADGYLSVFTAAHTDCELPWGCCTFLAGFRVEWGYTWMDILPQTSDLQDINFLFTAGVQF